MQRFVAVAAMIVALALPVAARASVADSSAAGFTLKYDATVHATPAAAMAAVERVGAWWNMEHSYSNDGRNLSLDARPGGCFCEKLPGGGGVKHMEVVAVLPAKRLVLLGGLGPLQSMGATGAMTWAFQPADGGTRITLTYAVSAWRAGGMAALAPLVDGVIADQFDRAVKYVDRGRR